MFFAITPESLSNQNPVNSTLLAWFSFFFFFNVVARVWCIFTFRHYISTLSSSSLTVKVKIDDMCIFWIKISAKILTCETICRNIRATAKFLLCERRRFLRLYLTSRVSRVNRLQSFIYNFQTRNKSDSLLRARGSFPSTLCRYY